MALFYAVEFPNESNKKNRGPFVMNNSRVCDSGLSTVKVTWDVVDTFGDIHKEEFEGTL